jgi:hypothetical protein
MERKIEFIFKKKETLNCNQQIKENYVDYNMIQCI